LSEAELKNAYQGLILYDCVTVFEALGKVLGLGII